MASSYKQSLHIKRIILYFVMVLLALIAIVPVWVLIINGTRNNAQINAGLSIFPSTHAFDNWQILANRGDLDLAKGFLNSAIISISATLVCVYASCMTAYGIHVYKFRGRNILWGLIMVLIMLPASLSFIGFYQFVAKIHLTDTYIPLIVPGIASAVTVLFLKQYMDSVLSFDLIEAARIDGAGEFRTFNTIILPVLQPALATQCIFSFVFNWNNFMTPFVILSTTDKYTLPMMVQMLRGDIYRTEYGGIYLGIAVSLVPIIIAYVFLSRYIISGLTMGSVKE